MSARVVAAESTVTTSRLSEVVRDEMMQGQERQGDMAILNRDWRVWREDEGLLKALIVQAESAMCAAIKWAELKDHYFHGETVRVCVCSIGRGAPLCRFDIYALSDPDYYASPVDGKVDVE